MIARSMQLQDMLDIAEVPAEKRDEAMRTLRYWLEPSPVMDKSIARSRFDAIDNRGPPRNQKPYLDRIQAEVRGLQEALFALRENPYAHTDFWLADQFGPVSANEIERPCVFEVLAAIEAAATNERRSLEGRPGNAGNDRIVSDALSIFEKFSTIPPSADPSNPFRSFVEDFYTVGVGPLPDQPEVLTRSIRKALNESREKEA